MASSSLMDTLFQRTLEDLIKGLRQQLLGESHFISKALEEIRREIKFTDTATKATALLKLSYLSSLHGIDMSWADFHAVEVVSSARFAHKKIGYNAISQSFNEHTPVLLLITNQLRKDLKSTNEFEVSLALECLSKIANDDLARDLTPEVYTLLGSSKISVRKKAIGVVLMVFGKYPDAVRVCFKRLVENLESSDPQILSTVVGVFCELSTRDPKSYLPLAPEFYKILVDSRNNWVLIKVLKIFASLAPLEPRLSKRLVEPICEHMRKTGAKSLLFECIKTVVTSLSEYESAMKLAVEKIKEFLVEDDPNLKYLGLQGLLVAAPKHLWAVLENKEVVIKSLSDEDPKIKLESLRLVMALVSERNVTEIARVLVNYALKADPQFCNEILGSILSTCSRNLYEIIVDFDWYVSLLEEISRIPHCQKGEEIENQLIDIAMRVKDVRPELVRVSRDLIIDPALLGNPFMFRILSAAAWISGEYVEFSRNPFELMEALFQPRTILLPPLVRAIYIQSSLKVLIYCLHSYFSQNGSSSICHVNLGLGFSESMSERKNPEDSDSSNCKQDEGCNPRVETVSSGGYQPENCEDIAASHDETSTSAKSYTHKSIVNMLDLAEVSLSAISGSHDVEIQERTRNVLGFISMMKQVINSCLVEKEGSLEQGEVEASKVVKLMRGTFSEHFGPISVSAQERVSLPDGLILEENLVDLQRVCGDINMPTSDSFSFGNPNYGNNFGAPLADLQLKEDSEPSNESTSLLAEHRKRHGLYYLPAEKNEAISHDFPPANDPKLQETSNDEANDLVKLADQSFTTKRKPNHAKPRPVVVKLDEGDEIPIMASKKPNVKDDRLSGAVRDVLLGNESGSTSRNNMSDKAYSNKKGKEKQEMDLHMESKESLDDHENLTSRRNKHHNHSKERRNKSPRKKNNEGSEETSHKEKKKSSHRQSKHKGRQRADEALNVVAQTPVIPDFLL